ncbi:MAG: DUF4157 domain-containing protein [Planctomycetes bacterium]|nr:DUF4157 domain-containing protein [Planctomycetota bacterium]
MDSTLVIGGADRFEAQAEANEARILAAASTGRWEAMFDASADRYGRTIEGTVGARLQRRPVGGSVGRAMIQAAFGGLFGGSSGKGVGMSASAGPGDGTIVIDEVVVTWADAGAAAPPRKARVSPALEHARAPGGGGAAPAGFSTALKQSRGQALSGPLRAKMEQAFGGVDLSGVRIHTGPEAQSLTSSIHARAFATGGDVFFNRGEYDPHSARGLALLGHELTHVLQQRAGASPLPGAPPVGPPIGSSAALVSPLGRGGLVEAAGHGQAARLTAPDDRLRRKADGMLRRSPSPGGAGQGRGAPAAAPAPTGRGQVIIRALTVTLSGAGDAGAPSMVTVAGKGAGGGTAPTGFADLLARSAGSAMPARLNAQLGGLLGEDFGDVRIHTGEAAARAAAAIHAEAFAIGRDVYFGAGRWDPNSPRGVALLGHELTHVAQERGGAKTISAKEVRAKGDGVYGTARAYWEDVGTRGAGQGGIRGNAKAVGAAVMLAFADPLEVNTDAEQFEAALRGGMRRWGGKLSFDDPQRNSPQEVYDYFLRTGDAQFNRAAPRDDFPGGAKATQQLEEWLRRSTEGGGRVTLEALIHQAIIFNRGNVTLAMGSLAEILCKGSNRALAGRIQGLRGHKKDYYLFAGAFVGLQPSEVTRGVGAAGSAANIAGNPIVYSAGGLYEAGAGVFTSDAERRRKGLDLAKSRWGVADNWNKVREFGIGYRVAAEVTGRGSGLPRVMRKGLVVAGHDAYEQQALQNERAILQAMQGGPAPAARPGYMALRASGRLARRTGVVSAKGRWDRFKAYVSETLEQNRQFWDEVGVAGIQRGGVLGYTQAGLAAVFSGINQPELARAYVEGLGSGVVQGVKGVVNMVVHPIETAQGLYRMVVHFDETKAGLKEKVREYVEAASSDPEKFARMTGELVGQIEVALIGPKVIGGPKEVLGAVRTARNVIPRGRTLWYYTDDAGAAAIKGTGQVGRTGSASVFATPLDPLLGGSRSLMGMFARNVFLGGRLDFVKKAGQLLPSMRLKGAFTQAIGFKGGQFRHILFTEVETAVARVAKSAFPQYAASGPQQVQVVAQAILSRRETLHALLDGAGMLGSGSNMVVGNTEVPFREIIESTLDYYGMGELLKKERSPTEQYLGDSPGERLRRGGRLGRALEALEEPGLPLELSVRNRLEAALGADLGAVRVHTGDAAERLAREIGAEAFTLGNKIFMGEGAWRPDTVEGLGTLVHEATHVVQAQQGKLAGPATPMRTAALEAEAYARERAFVAGARAGGRPVTGPLAAEAAARPAPPPLVVREAPPAQEELPAPEVGAAPTRALRKAAGPSKDPIQRVMDSWSVAELSREEFLEECTERVLELLREEAELDAERGATNLAWSYDLPLS